MAYDPKQARWSQRAFRRLVWPAISGVCGGGDLQSVEDSASVLDILGGVDALQVFSTGVRTIAQRTQRIKGPEWRTFTIRYKVAADVPTELDKRIKAIDRGYALPVLTVQGYVYDDEQAFGYAGIVSTREYYVFVRENLGSFKVRVAQEDKNEFLVIPWSRLADSPVVPFVEVAADGIAPSPAWDGPVRQPDAPPPSPAIQVPPVKAGQLSLW